MFCFGITVAVWSLLIVVSADTSILMIDLDSVTQTIPDRFISVTIDTSVIQANWSTLDLGSDKLKRLAKGLSPCYLRVGGSTADFLQFQPPGQRKISYVVNSNNLKLTNFSMSALQWDQLNLFVETVGWDLVFDLNSLLRQNGQWSPDNAIMLLEYTVDKGYKVAGWELGNEPDVWRSLGYKINGTVHAADYKRLRTILNQYPEFRNGIVIGPSVTMLTSNYVYLYLKDFLDASGPDIVTNPTFHHYYGHGPDMTVADFMKSSVLNSLEKQIDLAQGLGSAPEFGKFWLSETSSAWGGGAKGMSDKYVAGFMWLDKLGLSAIKGIGSVVRQDFYGGNYGLIDLITLDPNPDYWLSWIFNKFVGKSVLGVISPDRKGDIRMYAHCTQTKGSIYKPGSITVYGMNLRNESTTITFPQFKSELHLYLLEPVGPEGLLSQVVAVNGKVLQLKDDFPDITSFPQIVYSNFTFPQQSFGFVVIPDANVPICHTWE